MRRSFAGSGGLIGLGVGVALAVAVGVEHERRPALRLRGVARRIEHLRVQPAHHRTAAARPQRVVGVVAELRMVRRVTRLDERVLHRLRIEHREMAHGAIHRKRLRRRMIRSRLAPRRVVGAAHRRRKPEPAVAPEHRVVVVDARLPDALAAPVGRRLQRIERRRVSRTEVERHLRIPHRRLEGRRHVLHRIEDRHRVRAVLGRPEQRPVGVDRRVPAIARDEIVEIVLLVHPVAQRDDDVAFDALRPRRLGERQFALGDAIGPVAEVGERHLAEVVQLVEHLLPDCPDCTRRFHASAPVANVPSDGGIVRVDSCPS